MPPAGLHTVREWPALPIGTQGKPASAYPIQQDAGKGGIVWQGMSALCARAERYASEVWCVNSSVVLKFGSQHPSVRPQEVVSPCGPSLV